MKHVLPAAALLASGSVLLAPPARADGPMQPTRPVWGCVDPRATTALAIPDGRLRNRKWVDYVHRTGQCALLPAGKPLVVLAHQGSLLLVKSPGAAENALAVYTQSADMVAAPAGASAPVPAPADTQPQPPPPAATEQATPPAAATTPPAPTPSAPTTPSAPASPPQTPAASDQTVASTPPVSAPAPVPVPTPAPTAIPAPSPASPAPGAAAPDAGAGTVAAPVAAGPAAAVAGATAGAVAGTAAAPDATVSTPAAPVPSASNIAPTATTAAPADAPAPAPEPAPVAPSRHSSSGMLWLALIVLLALLALVGAAVMVSRQQRRFAHVEDADWPERDEHIDPMASPSGVVPKVQPEPTPQNFRKVCVDVLEQGGWTIQPSFAAGAGREGAPDILGRRRDAVLAVRCRGGSATVTPEIIDEVAAMGQQARAHVTVLATPAPLTRRAHDEAMRLHVHVLDQDELGSLSADPAV